MRHIALIVVLAAITVVTLLLNHPIERFVAQRHCASAVATALPSLADDYEKHTCCAHASMHYLSATNNSKVCLLGKDANLWQVVDDPWQAADLQQGQLTVPGGVQAREQQRGGPCGSD